MKLAAESGCCVLTGGPGVGKTMTVRTMVRMLLGLRRSVALAAPTGKAARRLSEVVGLEAQDHPPVARRHERGLSAWREPATPCRRGDRR